MDPAQEENNLYGKFPDKTKMVRVLEARVRLWCGFGVYDGRREYNETSLAFWLEYRNRLGGSPAGVEQRRDHQRLWTFRLWLYC